MASHDEPVAGEAAMPGAQPASWRDVYHLLEQVENRITKKLDEVQEAQSKVTEDHELRIRVLERSDIGRNGGDRRQSDKESAFRSNIAVIVSTVAVVFSVIFGLINAINLIGAAK